MRKKLKIISFIVVLLSLGYLFVFDVAIPFAAKVNIPYKWKNIPLGQKRNIIHEYLGMPDVKEWNVKGDEWNKRVKKNIIFLNVIYNPDSVAKRYCIGFVYNTWFGKKIYYLKRDSI